MGFAGETYLIKRGTYQDGEFGWRYFGNGGRPMNPTVVLWPDRRKMQVFSDPRDAVELARLASPWDPYAVGLLRVDALAASHRRSAW
jgi:hypothetical protein